MMERLAALVLEDPQFDDALDKAIYLRLGVVVRHAEEYQIPLADLGDNLAVNRHARLCNTLDKCLHAICKAPRGA